MYSMMKMTRNAVSFCSMKVDSWFKRTFKEQAGGAELIATLIIVGIVLILAFAFKTQLTGLVKNLWKKLIVDGNENTTQSDASGGYWE